MSERGSGFNRELLTDASLQSDSSLVPYGDKVIDMSEAGLDAVDIQSLHRFESEGGGSGIRPPENIELNLDNVWEAATFVQDLLHAKTDKDRTITLTRISGSSSGVKEVLEQPLQQSRHALTAFEFYRQLNDEVIRIEAPIDAQNLAEAYEKVLVDQGGIGKHKYHLEALGLIRNAKENFIKTRENQLYLLDLYKKSFNRLLEAHQGYTGEKLESIRQLLVDSTMQFLCLRNVSGEVLKKVHNLWQLRIDTDPKMMYGTEDNSFPIAKPLGERYSSALDKLQEKIPAEDVRAFEKATWVQSLVLGWREKGYAFRQERGGKKQTLDILVWQQYGDTVIPIKVSVSLKDQDTPSVSELTSVFKRLENHQFSQEYQPLEIDQIPGIKIIANQAEALDKKPKYYQDLVKDIDVVMGEAQMDGGIPETVAKRLADPHALFANLNQAVFCLELYKQDGRSMAVGMKTLHRVMDGLYADKFLETLKNKTTKALEKPAYAPNVAITDRVSVAPILWKTEGLVLPDDELLGLLPSEVVATQIISAEAKARLENKVTSYNQLYTHKADQISLNRCLTMAWLGVTNPTVGLAHFLMSRHKGLEVPMTYYPKSDDYRHHWLPLFKRDLEIGDIAQFDQIKYLPRFRSWGAGFARAHRLLYEDIKDAQKGEEMVAVLVAIASINEKMLGMAANLIADLGDDPRAGTMVSVMSDKKDGKETIFSAIFGTAQMTSQIATKKMTSHGGVLGITTNSDNELAVLARFNYLQLQDVVAEGFAKQHRLLVPLARVRNLLEACDNPGTGGINLKRALMDFNKDKDVKFVAPGPQPTPKEILTWVVEVAQNGAKAMVGNLAPMAEMQLEAMLVAQKYQAA